MKRLLATVSLILLTAAAFAQGANLPIKPIIVGITWKTDRARDWLKSAVNVLEKVNFKSEDYIVLREERNDLNRPIMVIMPADELKGLLKNSEISFGALLKSSVGKPYVTNSEVEKVEEGWRPYLRSNAFALEPNSPVKLQNKVQVGIELDGKTTYIPMFVGKELTDQEEEDFVDKSMKRLSKIKREPNKHTAFSVLAFGQDALTAFSFTDKVPFVERYSANSKALALFSSWIANQAKERWSALVAFAASGDQATSDFLASLEKTINGKASDLPDAAKLRLFEAMVSLGGEDKIADPGRLLSEGRIVGANLTLFATALTNKGDRSFFLNSYELMTGFIRK